MAIKSKYRMLIGILFGVLILSYSVPVLAVQVRSGVVSADVLNIRSGPGTSYDVVGKIYEGNLVSILDYSDGWYKVKTNNVTGWVLSKYVDQKDSSDSMAYIIADDVNVRSGASTSSSIVGTADKGEKVAILSRGGDWFNVRLSNGTTGWVYSKYVSGNAPSRSGNSFESLRQKIVETAKKYLGVRYVYGGSSPSGFDCSGFTKYVYGLYGIDLARVAASQAQDGVYVSKGNLRQGDLVFFDTNGGHNYINHTGIYIGDGCFIHASSGRGRVTISDINSGFYNGAYMTARKYIRE